MRSYRAQLSVEVLSPGLRVIGVAGVLDRGTVARLAVLIEAQLARPDCTGHLVVDLGEVSFFATDDFEALLRARDSGRESGVSVHLAGLTAREALLPIAVTSGLAEFSMFPTVEHAERELVGRGAAPPELTRSGSSRARTAWNPSRSE